jgi:arsenate reductase
MEKLSVLFLCTGNSCRSQMAEGFARALRADVIDVYSAGVEPHGMNDRAIAVMAEAGIDISRQRSKHMDELAGVAFDYVVTVCGHAHETCPMFSGTTRVVHVGFDDPPALAKLATNEAEALAHYRRVRDEIKQFVMTLPQGLTRSNVATSGDTAARSSARCGPARSGPGRSGGGR